MIWNFCQLRITISGKVSSRLLLDVVCCTYHREFDNAVSNLSHLVQLSIP